MSVLACIGIDPGVSGGWCTILVEDGIVQRVHTTPMPDGENEICDMLRRTITMHHTKLIALEKVGGFMGDGGKNKAAAHTMFAFGENYGLVKGILRSERVGFHVVRPVEWQTYHETRKVKGERQHKWKSRLKEKALSLYPNEAFQLKVADAVLIATYAYHKYGRFV